MTGPQAATVTADPPSGYIAPQATLSVVLSCKAGSAAQRIRGVVDCKVFGEDGLTESYTQSTSFRGEVQAPKTIMYPMSVDLGYCYVGMPVYFDITVENICNIPTRFKMDRPGGGSKQYDIAFIPARSELGAKQAVTVRCKFTPRVTGRVDDLIANKVFGCRLPLGFALRADLHGRSLEFLQVQRHMRVPRPLGRPSDTRYKHGLQLPKAPKDIPTLRFTPEGSDVPLYDRQKLRFVVRNLSAIPVRYRVGAKEFFMPDAAAYFALKTPSSSSAAAVLTAAAAAVADQLLSPMASPPYSPSNSVPGSPSGRLTSRRRLVDFEGGAGMDEATVLTLTSLASEDSVDGFKRTDLLIAPHEDGVSKFHSQAGKRYLGSRVKREEDLAYLKSGKGCSYVIEPAVGELPPWGVQVVTVRAYNDMPGVYDDDIVFEVLRRDADVGAGVGVGESVVSGIAGVGGSLALSAAEASDGVVERHVLPLQMTSTGCPFVIDRNTLGMSFLRDAAVPGAAGAGVEMEAVPEDDEGEEGGVGEGAGAGAVAVAGEVVQDEEEEASEGVQGQALLLMGKACLNSSPLERSFRIKNDGCKPGRIKWKVRASYPGVDTTGVKLELIVGEDGKVTSKINFWDDLLRSAPFEVEPKSAVIAAYSSQNFRVRLTRTDVWGKIRAVFTGTVVIDGKGLDEGAGAGAGDGDSTSDDSATVDHNATDDDERSSSNYKLTILAMGDFYPPAIRLDKSRIDVPKAGTVAPAAQAIVLKTQAPALLGKAGTLRGAAALAALSEACWRAITLTNPLELNLVFSVSTEGPFVIKATGALGGIEAPVGVAGSAPPVRALVSGVRSISSIASSRSKNVSGGSGAGAGALVVPGAGVGAGVGAGSLVDPHGSVLSGGSSVYTPSSSLGRIFSLLPQQSASFSVAFMPKRDFRQSLKTTLVGVEGGGKPTQAEGRLIVAFSTGQSLVVPISAKVATPFITASSSSLWFGVCHVTATIEGTLLLSNPTDVPARWTVAHVPSTDAPRRTSSIQVAGFNERGPESDDPSVFEIGPGTGVVRGPTISVPSAVGAPPKDFNRVGDGSVVQQRLSETCWVDKDKSSRLKGTTGFGVTGAAGGGAAGGGALTLTIKDTLQQRFEGASSSEARSDALYPMPVQVAFKPRKNLRYCSRFRFTCEYGNAFDVILQGEGTYEEHEHQPLQPFPR